MDYSLLVGLNTNERTLVLGIIGKLIHFNLFLFHVKFVTFLDYIRTFTFDKRIESYVKQTGLLGGQGKLPTVVSPILYKQRFTEAMERYKISLSIF